MLTASSSASIESKPEAVWAEKWEIVANLVGRGLQHQILDQHLLDAGAQIGLGHKRKWRECRKFFGRSTDETSDFWVGLQGFCRLLACNLANPAF